MTDPVLIPVGLIDPTPAKSVRAGQNTDTLTEYTEAVAGGADLPAVTLFGYPDGEAERFCLGDGGHRLEAWTRAGRTKVPGLVEMFATRDDAERAAYAHAAAANADHGLRRSNADKRAAVRTTITRPENAALSDRQVAKLCRVNHELVGRVRHEMTAAGNLTGPASTHGRDYRPAPAPAGGGGTASGQTYPISTPPPDTYPAENAAPAFADDYTPSDDELAAMRESDAASVLPLRPATNHRPPSDPNHPYAELMKAVTGLSRAITLAINDPKNGKLLNYLTGCGLVERWDRTIDGRRSVGSFKLLRGLRHIIDLAGRGGSELKPARVKWAYEEASKDAAA